METSGASRDPDAVRPAGPPCALDDALDHKAPKQPWVDWLFTKVAPRYDLGNDIMSLGWHTRWKERLVEMAEPRPDDRVLDLATGTGDVAWMLAPRVREVVGADINVDMMALAEAKRPPGVTNVSFVPCDATKMPFPDASFDAVVCAFAGRGFPAWDPVLSEVRRVLKPGGRFLNLDFARPPQRWWDATYRGWMIVSGAVLGTVLHGDPQTYVYIPKSMRAYPGQRWLDARMKDHGFDTRLVETTACLMAYNVGRVPVPQQ
jgi:demethylmenaquinone methyltransferase/2-methoxy-6-polyprenyl-1,4-benzoquinol methylase